ncbi:MAG: mechanosensitive ion channel [Deltaproteobacteria bacterium]|nr:mechanosensitive ion channel [Deltaproteobacteria bacterium]
MPEWVQGETAQSLIRTAEILGLAWVAWAIARWGLAAAIRRLVRASAITWDDALVKARVFNRMANIAPAAVVYYGVELIPGVTDEIDAFVQRVAVALMVVVTAATLNAFLAAVNEIYSAIPEYRNRPITGYLQVAMLGISLVAALIVVATLLDRSPWLFLSGIGAMTAVLMLVFRDTILSFVATIQIAGNDMIRIGDWIEMPQAGADGDVIDVALHTVKVQNWDKTISTIPTHKFISDSFKNWRGMSLSGGRRIKRAIYVDMNSVRFLTEEEIRRFHDWSLLRDYIIRKTSDIAQWNAQPGRDGEINADIRRLTNIGTLRAYILAYLGSHPKIHHSGYTLMVRQLMPSDVGLPIEIYCFSNIFDHILAMMPEFDLRIFQAPAGADFDRIRAGDGGGAIG